jgi:peptide chain release factor 1
MFEAAEHLRAEFAQLESALVDPDVHADLARARRIGRRYAELTPIVRALDEHTRLSGDLAAARELGSEDQVFAAEAVELAERLDRVTERLTKLLAPRDPNDSADALMEIKSGEGGEESALFAGDLLKMYTRYAETRGWKVEVLDAQETDLGGFKSVTVAIKAGGHGGVVPPGANTAIKAGGHGGVVPPGANTAIKAGGHGGVVPPGAGTAASEPGQMPYGVLKFEGGVHRVQRVPVTESQGRVHTSAAGVLVMPEVEETEIEIADDDLRIDVYRSSGPGGQGVNTTDSAVRITHLPSGIVVSCQNERSQLQNREQAMRMLRARLTAAAEEEAASAASAARRSQVRTVDRSERIRTYNFPENRISDHRIGFKAYNLDQVLNGDLQALITALTEADTADRLAAVGSTAGS